MPPEGTNLILLDWQGEVVPFGGFARYTNLMKYKMYICISNKFPLNPLGFIYIKKYGLGKDRIC